MADLIDSASGELQQASNQLTRAGVRTSVAIAAGTTRVSARIGARAVGGTVRGLVALLDAVRQATRSRSQEGEVNLRQFTHVADGKREVVPIKDAEVARQLSRELRRHGVTFAIEKNADGSRTFHVQGKDAALIEHALTVASIRVDERITRARERAGTPEQEAPDASLAQEPGSRVIELDEAQRTTLVEALRESGQAQESADAHGLAAQVERDGEVTLTEENVETIDAALGGSHELPEHMGDVAAAVDEEKAAIATADVDGREDVALAQEATAPELAEPQTPDATVTLVFDRQQRESLAAATYSTAEQASRATGGEPAQRYSESLTDFAEKVGDTGRVELTPENTQRLHDVFTDHNWTPGLAGDQTPENMRWVVGAVAQERQSLEERTVDSHQQTVDVAPAAERDAGERVNPYLRDDLPAQTVPVVAGDANVPDKPVQAAEQQRPPQQAPARDRELNPRDATRERVAKRIDVKVTDIKEQQKTATRPTSRGPQRTQADEQRPPQTRR